MVKVRSLGAPSGRFNGSTKSEVGALIGNRRRELGFGLAEVSSKTGLSIQFISNIEHGRAPLPARYIKKIANCLQLNSAVVGHVALKQTRAYREIQKFA